MLCHMCVCVLSRHNLSCGFLLPTLFGTASHLFTSARARLICELLGILLSPPPDPPDPSASSQRWDYIVSASALVLSVSSGVRTQAPPQSSLPSFPYILKCIFFMLKIYTYLSIHHLFICLVCACPQRYRRVSISQHACVRVGRRLCESFVSFRPWVLGLELRLSVVVASVFIF